MNVSSARKFLSRRNLLSSLAGLVLMAIPMSAVAGGTPDDIAAYQSAQYGAAQYGQPYGQPMPPPPQYQYPGSSGSYARHNQLVAQLNYAEAQYNQARQSGNWQAAKYWRKDIKHLQRELSGGGHAEGSGFGASGCLPSQQRSYAPPASAYARPTQEYGSPSGPAYAQPYPPTTPPYGYATTPPYGYATTPPYGYAGAPPAPYPPTGYPSAGYPNTAAASPYGAAGASGSMGGLSSLLGPLLGTGSAPSAAGYPNSAAGSSNGTPAATGSMGDIVNSLMGSMRGSGSMP
jgi:hypothetical protein